jgi:hypothetical protein
VRKSVSAVLITSSALAGPLDHWRFPSDADILDDWKTFRSEVPEPYHVEGDFDGNGTPDNIWLLFKKDGAGWGLLALMNGTAKEAQVLKLFGPESPRAQSFGLQLVPPGKYATACGKGYWECSKSESAEVELKNWAFSFYKFESASTLYYWDGAVGAFVEVAESD